MSRPHRYRQHLAHFSKAGNPLLKGILRGVEKESLRVSPDGGLSQTEHPRALGSAMTHPHITTDYSEALLEFITEPFNRVSDLLRQLDDVHRYTYSVLGEERLWPASMPCSLKGDEGIPVARYGSSNSGLMKTVYRRGLGHRYGRTMQTIAGVHYNFSLPDDFWRDLQRQEGDEQLLQDYKTQRYFDLIRNFRRYSWLLIYLFGAAPAVCRSFVRGKKHSLQPFGDDEHSLYAPHATSLRMGDLGYQSDAQQQMTICYNDLSTYLQTLCEAITRPHPAYQAIGVKDSEGRYQQLNTSLLQIENEFYSSVRPKRTTQRGETALQALRLRGVEYVEVRCVDLNPYEPLGISAEQIHFLDAFLLYCLLADSPRANDLEYRNIQENQSRIVYRGREPGLTLQRGEEEVAMADWAGELLAGMEECAGLLDQCQGDGHFRRAVADQREKVTRPELTPSARILEEMQREGKTFFGHAMALAEEHRNVFARRPLEPALKSHFEQLAEASLADQRALEAADRLSFEDYLERYYRQYEKCECQGAV
ncbi:glutamate--cysteine ligase [Marinimicrobium sp. C2-29]|uniref:glutamate--cysteine ligase n=1 Tax=Marinimicrobium sp. C2-29 TaxID=3139825 RepID=UPI00313A14B1